jgi:hypothetical protein
VFPFEDAFDIFLSNGLLLAD